MEGEKDLLRRAKDGDIQAFEALIAEYQTVVFSVALRIFQNREDAADMAQEALIKAYKNISRFEGKSKFSTWLYKITYNVCIDELRKKKKTEITSIDAAFENGDSKLRLTDTAPSPEEALENKELSQTIYSAIDSLSEEHRIAIILRDANGYSYEEIAEIQCCTLGTVKSRINRARRRLKEILSDETEQTAVISRQKL
jgi:RNA polymerase sigma-70 factor (ECF subfamily)